MVFRAVVLAEGDEVGVADFPQISGGTHRLGEAAPIVPASTPIGPAESLMPHPVQELAAPQAGSITPQLLETGATLQLLDSQGEVRPIEEIEAETIRFAISHYRGQMSEVARRLQIGRSTLYRKLDAMGLQQRVPENDTPSVVAG